MLQSSAQAKYTHLNKMLQYYPIKNIYKYKTHAR